MPRKSNQKLKLIYILDILKRYSDEENPLNASDISEKLSDFGIEAERKSIYDDITYLEQYGADIIKTTIPKKGWFIGDREFEVPEIYLLSDAVRSAKFISAKKTRELLAKLNSMLSETQEKRRANVFFSAGDKCGNEEIYYSIDKISSAIENGHQIKLEYSSRVFANDRSVKRKTKEMIINPYALTWQDDCYYLIGNHAKYDNLIHLRVDRINDAEELSVNARQFSEVCEYKEFFDTADYTNKLFGMYTGDSAQVEFCCNREISEPVLDRFSENIFITNVTEKTFNFKVNAVLSDALVTWVMNYGSSLKVVKPEALKDMIKNRAKEVLEVYGE